MKKFPVLLIGALVATCAFAAVAAFARAADEVTSTVSIKFKEGGGSGGPYDPYAEDRFKGKVRGDKGCKRERTVKVFKEGGGRRGKADTNERGRYTIPLSNPTGDFFAKVKRAKIEKNNGDKIKCSRAKSDSISVP